MAQAQAKEVSTPSTSTISSTFPACASLHNCPPLPSPDPPSTPTSPTPTSTPVRAAICGKSPPFDMQLNLPRALAPTPTLPLPPRDDAGKEVVKEVVGAGNRAPSLSLAILLACGERERNACTRVTVFPLIRSYSLLFPLIPSYYLLLPLIPSYSLLFPLIPSFSLLFPLIPSYSLLFPLVPSYSLLFPLILSWRG